MKNWIWRWGPAILVMALIFLASATAGSDLPKFGIWDLVTKKGGHMFGYALLAIAYFHGLNAGKTMTRTHFIAALVLSMFYAMSDEWHQRFTPGRTPSVQDVVIDTIGAGIGLAIWYWARVRFPKQQKT
jgi:VanZ family protein